MRKFGILLLILAVSSILLFGCADQQEPAESTVPEFIPSETTQAPTTQPETAPVWEGEFDTTPPETYYEVVETQKPATEATTAPETVPPTTQPAATEPPATQAPVIQTPVTEEKSDSIFTGSDEGEIDFD